MADKKCEREISLEANTVQFTFPSLDQAQFPPLIADLNKMRALLPQLALHGASQKIGDANASEKDHAEAYNLSRETIEQLENEVWSKKRAKGEPSVTLLVEAIARQRGMDPAAVKDIWDALPDEAKARIKADDNTKAVVLAIKAERAAAKAAGSEATEALAAFG